MRKFYLSFFLTYTINIFARKSGFQNHKSTRGLFFTVLTLLAAISAETQLNIVTQPTTILIVYQPYQIFL
jgi:hypothetical protein